MDERTMCEALPEVREMRRTAHWLALRGYAEAGGGNLSVRCRPPAEVVELPPLVTTPLPAPAPELVGTHLLVTASGSRMRDLADDAGANAALLRIEPEGLAYTVIWGNPRVTSEFSSHLLIHRMTQREELPYEAVVHTHPAALVALTLVPAFRDEARLNAALFAMHHETPIFMPEGVALVGRHKPGSMDIAQATVARLVDHRMVLWEQHGALALGNTLSQALDYVEMVDKAAQVYWHLASAGVEISL